MATRTNYTNDPSVPLVNAESQSVEVDAAYARALTEEELAQERNKGTRVIEGQAWNDYYSTREPVQYGAWRDPSSRRVYIYRDDGDVPPGLLFCWCFWLWFLILVFIVAPIIYYYA